MSKKRYEHLEILQDPQQQSKGKRKRKLGPVYIPWRWVILSFAGGGALVIVALFGLRPVLLPEITPFTMIAPLPTLEGSATPLPIPTLTGGGEYLRTLSWVNGRLAAAGSDTLRVYNDTISPGAAHWMRDYGQSVNRSYNNIALSPDGSQVAGIVTLLDQNDLGKSEIAVWDARTGDLLRTFTAHIGGSPGFGLDAIAYTPDSTRMITSAGDGRAIVWDAATGAKTGVMETGGTGTWAMNFQPDNRRLVIVTQPGQGQADLQIWDVDTQRQLETLAINRQFIVRLALSDKADYMAVQEWVNDGSFLISIWDVKRGEEIGMIPVDEHKTVSEIVIEPGLLGLAVFVGSRTDPATGEVLDEEHSEVRAFRWQIEDDGTFQYALVGAKSDYVMQAEIRELHFTIHSDAAWLNYITGASGSNLQRWNIVTGAVEALPFW